MRLLGAVLVLALTGCSAPKSLALRVDAGHVQGAELSARSSVGKASATPDHCQTPCSLTIPVDSDQELTLRAPGYYPAVVVVPVDAVGLFVLQNPKGTLIVPMQTREEMPPASP